VRMDSSAMSIRTILTRPSVALTTRSRLAVSWPLYDEGTICRMANTSVRFGEKISRLKAALSHFAAAWWSGRAFAPSPVVKPWLIWGTASLAAKVGSARGVVADPTLNIFLKNEVKLAPQLGHLGPRRSSHFVSPRASFHPLIWPSLCMISARVATI
jgi:hypothetical protein